MVKLMDVGVAVLAPLLKRGRRIAPKGVEPRIRITRSAVVFCLAAGLGASAILIAAMPRGLGVGADASVYVAAARNLLRGHDLTSRGLPLTHFPPGYPLLLAANGLVTGDPYRGAALLNLLCFSATLALAGLIAYVGSRGSWGAMAAGVILTGCTWRLFTLHQEIVSEPAFFTCLMVSVYAMGRHVERPRWGSLLAAATAIAIATTLRYVAASILAPAVLLALLAKSPRAARLKRAAVLAAIACAPLAVWMLHNHFAHGNAANRPLVARWLTAHDLRTMAKCLASHFAPGTPLPLRPCALAIMVVGTGAALVRATRQPGLLAFIRCRGMLASLALVAGSYLASVVLAKSLMDAAISFENRMLVPFNVLLTLACACLLLEGRWRPRPSPALVAGATMLLAVMALNLRWLIAQPPSNVDRLHFAGPAWRQEPGIRLAESLPAEMTIYSNEADAVEFLTGRPARMLPDKYSPLSSLPNEQLAQETADLRAQLLTHQAALILFDNARSRPCMIGRDDLPQILSDLPAVQVAGARVYGTSEIEQLASGHE